MAKGDFVSRAVASAAAVQDDKDAALKKLLKQDGGGRTVNEVNDLSPQDLRAAVDEGGLLDRNGMMEELALVDGVSSEEAEEQTSEESDSAVFDRVWDSRVKREAWEQAGHDAADYRGDGIGLEEFLLHRAAELRAADRDAMEELVGNSDPGAGRDYDPAELSDEELADRLKDFEGRQLLGDEDNPLDPETIFEQQKGDLRGELNDLGVLPEETRDWTWEEMVLELDRRRPPETGTQPPKPEERESIPRPDPPDGPPTLDDGDSPPTSDPPKSVVPPGGGGSEIGQTPGEVGATAPDGGGDTSGGDSGSSSGSGDTGDGSEPSGPPAGSTHYGSSIGPGIGGETGYRDTDGNWYESDGSPMDSEKAERMKLLFEDEQLTEGSIVRDDDPDDDSTTDDSTTDAADTELTPVDPDAPTREDIDRYRSHIPDQGVAPTRNQGATDPSDPTFDDGLASGEITWGRDSPSDPPDEGSGALGDIDEDLGVDVDPDNTRVPGDEPEVDGPVENPGDIDTTPGDPDFSYQVPGTADGSGTSEDESPPENEPPAVMVDADLNISGELPLAKAILPADAREFGAGAGDDEEDPDIYLVQSLATDPDEELVRGEDTAESDAEIEWQPEQVTRYGVEEESDLEKFVVEEEAAPRGSVTPLIDLPDDG